MTALLSRVISANRVEYNDSVSICLVAMDQTELEASKEAMRQIAEHREELRSTRKSCSHKMEELRAQGEELQTRNGRKLIESESNFTS